MIQSNVCIGQPARVGYSGMFGFYFTGLTPGLMYHLYIIGPNGTCITAWTASPGGTIGPERTIGISCQLSPSTPWLIASPAPYSWFLRQGSTTVSNGTFYITDPILDFVTQYTVINTTCLNNQNQNNGSITIYTTGGVINPGTCSGSTSGLVYGYTVKDSLNNIITQGFVYGGTTNSITVSGLGAGIYSIEWLTSICCNYISDSSVFHLVSWTDYSQVNNEDCSVCYQVELCDESSVPFIVQEPTVNNLDTLQGVQPATMVGQYYKGSFTTNGTDLFSGEVVCFKLTQTTCTPTAIPVVISIINNTPYQDCNTCDPPSRWRLTRCDDPGISFVVSNNLSSLENKVIKGIVLTNCLGLLCQVLESQCWVISEETVVLSDIVLESYSEMFTDCNCCVECVP